MKLSAHLLGVTVVCLTVSATVQAAEPGEEPGEETREEWYGWQTLTVAGASLGVGTMPAVPLGVHPFTWPLGLGGCVFGGPIVHWKHGRIGRGFAVLGMNAGITTLALGASLPIGCQYEKCDGFYFEYMWIMSYVGAMIGVGIDVAFLSTYRPPPSKVAERGPRLIDTLTPMVDVRPDRTVVGVGGLF